MGTYIIDTWFSVDSNIGQWVSSPTGGVNTCSSLNSDILIGLNNPNTGGVGNQNVACQRVCDGTTLTPANMLLRVSTGLSNNAISLDGNPHVSFFGLPAGFQILSALFAITLSDDFSAGSGTLGFLQYDPLTESIGLNMDNFNTPHTLNFSNPDLPFVSGLDLLSNGVGFRVSGMIQFNFFSAVHAWNIAGSYTIVSASLSSSSLASHSPVTLTSTSLSTITGITVTGSGGALGSATITSVSSTTVGFTMPSMGSYAGPGMLVFEFSGSAPFMMPITIFLSDPSGLYELVPGKTDDTLYVDHSTGTMDVAIPNPFIKTGFING